MSQIFVSIVSPLNNDLCEERYLLVCLTLSISLSHVDPDHSCLHVLCLACSSDGCSAELPHVNQEGTETEVKCLTK